MHGATEVDPYSDEFVTEPWEDLALIRDAAPAVWLDGYGVWAIARHVDVIATLRDDETYSSSHGVGLADLAVGEPWRRPSILVEADPPEHTRNRKVVPGTMTPKALRSLEGALRGRRRSHRRRAAGATTSSTASMISLSLSRPRCSLGHSASKSPTRHVAGCSTMARSSSTAMGWRTNASARPWPMPPRRSGGSPRRPHVTRLRPGGIGAAIHDAAEAAGLTPDDGAMLVRSFLSAGVDTTVSGIAFTLRNLAADPDQWQLLRDDPSLPRNAFEETIRHKAAHDGFSG